MANDIVFLKPIGKVVSPVSNPVDEKWGDVVSEIHLKKEFASGLTGLETFSHIVVVYLMHESSWNADVDLVRRPQGRVDMPLTGIFAQRAKHRPNPVGITAVPVISITENVIKVKGLDAINNSPVIDIKPYFPVFDAVDDPVVPEWVNKLMEHYFFDELPRERNVLLVNAPALIKAAGELPKEIEEFFGRVNSKTDKISIARMKSPAGWSEPGQRPDFDEYSVVLKGMLRVAIRGTTIDVKQGQGVLCRRKEWVQYSTPDPDGAEYISVCMPAFSPELVHRDK